MKKLLVSISLLLSIFLINQPAFAADMCPDNSTPPQLNQPVGSTYRGGDGKVYKCELVNSNATWVAQSGVIFQIPNFGGFSNLSQIIDAVIAVILFGAGLFFFINLIIGGIQWIGAGGDAKAMESARSRLTNAFIGLIIVVGAFAITGIVSTVFGISILGGFKFNIP